MGSWIDPSMSEKYRNVIGEHPDDFFSNQTLREPMVTLFGEEKFRKIRDRTQVAGGVRVVNGDLLVLEGCMPHSCDTDSAVTVVDTKSGQFYTIFIEGGVLHTGGHPINDQSMNIDGFQWSAYEYIFNNYLESHQLRLRSRITKKGVEFI